MEQITGPVSKLDLRVWLRYSPIMILTHSLQRKSAYVDVLLDCDCLLPKREEARCVENLSIMSGSLGICLQKAHVDLVEGSKYDTNLAKTIRVVN